MNAHKCQTRNGGYGFDGYGYGYGGGYRKLYPYPYPEYPYPRTRRVYPYPWPSLLSGASTERLVPFGYKCTPGIDPYSGKGGGSLKSFGTESGAATFASSKNPDPPTIKPDMMAVCSRMVHYLLRKCGMT